MSPKKKRIKETEQATLHSEQPVQEIVIDLQALIAEIDSRLTSAEGKSGAPVVQQAVEHRQALIFNLGETPCALDVRCVLEVIREPVITRVPGLPGWVLGVASHHGDIISVVDLVSFLSIESRPRQRGGMIVAAAGDQRVGLVVGEIGVIYTFQVEHITSPPGRMHTDLVAYLSGVLEHGGEFIRLLDGERLLLGPEMQRFS